ncbi:MAG: cell division protein FtsZ [Patescibacteria group bacterium]
MTKKKKRGVKKIKQTLFPQQSQTMKPKAIITRIKVVGVGGCGGNVVSRMMEGDRMRGVEFIAINTDAQDLDRVMAHRKIYVGKALTRGLGAGMNPEIGKQAAEENRSEIGEVLNGADIVFVVAGMGGGTGTLGSSVVAEIAKEKGILTVAMVTKPFAFEGSQRMALAQDGLNRLKDKVDSLIVIPNDRVFTLVDKDTPLLKAFGFIDGVLKQAVSAISDLVNAPGIINVDFADIKAILKDAGMTLIGIGEASGQDRSVKGVNMAVNSPLLEISIDGAKGVLFSVAGGKDLKMSEVNDVAKAVTANLDPNAKVIFGAYQDRSLKEKSMRVTVIATGFSGVISGSRMNTPTLFFSNESPKAITIEEPIGRKEKLTSQNKEEKEREKVREEREKKLELSDQEPWEIPAFLRKKKK